MAYEAAAAAPLVLPYQRGLQHRTGRPILKTKSPSGGGASHVHVLTMRQTSVSVSVSISKYCRSFILYTICFIMFLLIRSYSWYTLLISYHFLFTRLFLFLLYVYFCSKYSYSQLYFDLTYFFDHQIIITTISLFLFDYNHYVEVQIFLQNISQLIYNIFFKFVN